jgi:predicted nucleic acid-binding protein
MAKASTRQRRYVVDTNVLAYYALSTVPFIEEVSVLFSEPFELIAPDSWYSEFLNVVWQTIRFQDISLEHGLELLEEVENLLNWSVPVYSLWREALVIAEEYCCSTYDSLFVALAEREYCNLLTFDQRLLKAFPEIANTPEQVLST